MQVGSSDAPGGDRDGLLSRRDLVRRTAGIGAALTLPSVLAACAGASGSAGSQAGSMSQAAVGTAGGKPRRGGQLVVALNDGGSSDTLSPWNIPTYSSAARANQVYERLFKYDATGTPVPGLALSAEPNAGGTKWRVKLRPGVTFHNGKTVTAEDVLYSFRYVGDPKHNSESLQRLQFFDLSASRVISPTELEFVLKQPLGDLKGLLASKTLWVVPTGMTDFSKPMGTGPFVFQNWQPGVRALYERNAHYWETTAAGGPPWVDSLQFQTITDDTARLNALLGGQVQEITFIGFSSAKAQASNSAMTVIRTPQPNTTPIYMQIDAPQFRDPRVRQALKLMLDREQMVTDVLLGYGSIGNDLFGKGLPSYNANIPQRPYDPEKAAALLKQAGVHHMQLTLPTSDAAQGMLQSAVVFKQQAAAAGVNVALQKLDSGTYFTSNAYLKTPFYQTNWGQNFESQALDGLLRNSPYNETHWYDKRWAAEFTRAQGIIDVDKRLNAYRALQEPLWQDGGYVVWGVYETLDAVSPKVRGIVPNVSPDYQNLGGLDFKYHWLAA